VDAWRLIATALLAVAGVVLVLLTMAKTRDRRGATGGQVAVSGAISVTVLAVLCVLTLTVLAPVAVWAVTGAAALAVGVMLVAG
jgi:hypothetical protein